MKIKLMLFLIIIYSHSNNLFSAMQDPQECQIVCIGIINAHSSVNCLLDLGDGRLAAGCDNGEIKIGNKENGNCIAIIKAHV